MTTHQNTITQSLENTGVLPVFKHADLYVWQHIVDLCYACGIRVMEFRDVRENRGLKIFPYITDYCSQYPDFNLGVNTMQNAQRASAYLKAGASYISSPFLREDMAEACSRYEALWIPGCNTLTDVSKAHALGAKVVSVLPGDYASSHLGAIRSDFPMMHLIPSSGNDLQRDNLTAWINAGVLCIRMEARLFPNVLVAVRDWSTLKRGILSELSSVRAMRSQNKTTTYSIL